MTTLTKRNRTVLGIALAIIGLALVVVVVTDGSRSPFEETQPLAAAVVFRPNGVSLTAPTLDTVRTRATLDSLLAMLATGRWEHSLSTTPTPLFSVQLLDASGPIAVIHICANCIVGLSRASGRPEQLVRSLSETEAATLARWFAVARP